MRTTSSIFVTLAASTLVAIGFATNGAWAAPATSFLFGVNADDCSSITMAANWLTPVNGQDNVYFQIHDLKTLGAIVYSKPVEPNQTSATHAFSIGSLPRGKHRLQFDVQVRVGTAPIVGVTKVKSVACVQP